MTRTRRITLIALTVALTTSGAYLRIPIGPVPISLQSFFVLLSGAVLGPGAGAAAMATYLLAGLAGLPVFTAGGGLHYLFSPTFGFLLSFPLASAITGLVAGRKWAQGPLGTISALACGTLAIYAVGIPFLWLNLKWVQHKEMTLLATLAVGMLPFLPGDLAKVIIGAWIVPPLRRTLAGSSRG